MSIFDGLYYIVTWKIKKTTRLFVYDWKGQGRITKRC